MQRYTVYLYPETALYVSGVTSTHHQERIQLYLQRLAFVTPLLLPVAIAEELELCFPRAVHLRLLCTYSMYMSSQGVLKFTLCIFSELVMSVSLKGQ